MEVREYHHQKQVVMSCLDRPLLLVLVQALIRHQLVLRVARQTQRHQPHNHRAPLPRWSHHHHIVQHWPVVHAQLQPRIHPVRHLRPVHIRILLAHLAL